MIRKNKLQAYRQKINHYYLANEQEQINILLSVLKDYPNSVIQQQAHTLVTGIRAKKAQQSLIEAFLHEYQLNSEEGILLMEMAEALLRIPDAATQDVFLQEKLGSADWYKHRLHSDSLLVTFSSAFGTLRFTFNSQCIKTSDAAACLSICDC